MANGSTVTGGPLRDLKYGGFVLTPDSEAKHKKQSAKMQYEAKRSPNGKTYSTAESVTGFIEQDCVFQGSEFSEFEELQDGVERSFVATTEAGTVITGKGIIDGEMQEDDGKATVKISGTWTER